MQRKLGMYAECLGKNTDGLELIKSVGFQAVFTCFYKRKDIETLRTKCDNLGLSFDFIHAPFENINSMWQDGDDLPIYNALKESVLSASEFKVPIICIHVSSGWTPPPITDVGLKRFDELIDLAAKNGVIVAVENQRLLDRVDFFMKRYAKSTNVQFCYDCGHEHCFTENVEFLKLFGDRLVCTHIHDNTGKPESGDNDAHLLPFDGNIDYKAMMKDLDACGYKGSLMLEVSKRRYGDAFTDEEFLIQAFDRIKKISLLK